MDGLSKLSPQALVVLGGGVVLLILSFLDWQHASYSNPALGISVSGGLNEWHGIGTLAALLVVFMLVWEVLRLLGGNVSLGSLSPGLVSVGLALLAVLFTLIAFLNKGDHRYWPAWIALLVALIVAAAAVMRARAEGVELPQASSASPAGTTGYGQPAEPAGYSEPAAPAAPVEPADPVEPAGPADPPDGHAE